MWVFTQVGLVSIVENIKSSKELIIRARERKTLEMLVPEYADKIVSIPYSDYHFRIFLDRKIAAKYVKKWVQKIDYSNFKGSIKDNSYHSVLMSIWSTFLNYALKKNPDNPGGAGKKKRLSRVTEEQDSLFKSFSLSPPTENTQTKQRRGDE